MCRNIKTLFNFEPPATHAEIHASALQFVRKLSGFNSPSQANAEAFDRAVAEVSASARRLLTSRHTQAPARDREIEAEKARERSRLRFGWNALRRLRDAPHGAVTRRRSMIAGAAGYHRASEEVRWPGISMSPGCSPARFSPTPSRTPCRVSAATGFRRRSLRHPAAPHP